jgi:hypothetical protein
VIIFIYPVSGLKAQVTEGLISSYYFSGNARDSVGGLHGTVHGASTATDRFGNANAAYCFDGKDDYISLGTNSDLRQHSMSISMWVKINDWNASHQNFPAQVFVSTRVRHHVEYYEAYTLAALYGNHKFCAGANSTIHQQVAIMGETAETDKWYHLIYMFDSDTSYLYVNGKFQQKSFKGFITTYLVTDSVVLGYCGNHMPDTFKYVNYSWLSGCVDDLKFYNRLLSPGEITNLYNEPDPKFVGKADNSNAIRLKELLRTLWYIPVIMLLLLIITILIVRWRIAAIRKREQERNEMDRQLAQMEMKALRSQMNPHFIFNAINSIQHYVLTNEKDLANKYLVKFSQLMRNILELSKQELISLKDELDTIRLYLEIESLRFNNAFSYSLDISDNINTSDFRLPPLIIQPFVENAIWHGLLLKEGIKDLRISVTKKDETIFIEIDDNGIGREASSRYRNNEMKRRSFGMEITRDRLDILEKIFGIIMTFEVTDKTDAAGASTGTKVLLQIKIKK